MPDPATRTESPGRPSGTSANDIFVGREREMAELNAALEDALGGRGRVVMLVGEPGIGKTRTAEELAGTARRRGAEVLWGRCHEQQGAPPFWPWAQVIAAQVEASSPDSLRAELGKAASVVAELAPAVAEKLPGLTPAPAAADPESARFRLFDAVTQYLCRVARSRPLLIVLDDLHWADASSLKLLEFAAQEVSAARLVILGTYRDVEVSRNHPLFASLGELARQRLYARVLLRGVSAADTGRLIEAVGRVTPRQDVTARVHAETEGNPLFVGEMARLLLQEGVLVDRPAGHAQPWDFRLPEGVKEVIGRRLNKLSGQANEALAAASVIGREFGLATLAAVGEGLTGDALAGVLEEAVRARLVDEDPRLPGRYRFSHALVRQTLYEELSTTRRVRLHARIAEALERSYGDASGDHAAELAHHYGEAEAVLGPTGLVKHSLAAGQRALAAYAYEEAETHFDTALRAHGERGDLTEAALHEGLGSAQEAWGSSPAASSDVFRHMKRAFEIYLVAGEAGRAVDLAIQHTFGRDRYMTDLLAKALEVAAPGSREAGLLLTRYGAALAGAKGGFGKAKQALDQALSVGRRLGDAEAWALARSASVDAAELHWQSAFESALKAIDVSRRAGNVPAEALAIFVAALAAFDLGLMAQAVDLENSARDLAAKTRNRVRLHQLADVSSTVALLLGQWETARKAIGQILELQPPGLAHITDRLYLESVTGRREAFEEQMAWLRQGLKSDAPAAWHSSSVYATVLLCGADDETLRSLALAAEPGLRLSDDIWWDTGNRLMRVASIGIIAVAWDDREAAAAVYPELKAARAAGTRLAGSTAMGVGPTWTSVDRVLGALADMTGDPTAAAGHFEDALAFCRRASYRPELAQTCHDYAAMFLDERGTASVSKARELVTEGLAITTELGMKPLQAKLEALSQRLATRRGGRPEYPDGLTEREVEVLRLVAAGKSNREISESLVISENTAIAHVRNILSKINVANRTEAAAYAHRHGLATPPTETPR